MPGFCGWLASGPVVDAQRSIDVMTRELVRFAPSETKAVAESDWALGVSAHGRGGMLFADDEAFVAVFGRPEAEAGALDGAGDDLARALVAGYREQGAAFFSQLRGVFSIAVGLPKERRLIVATDRIGIEPVVFAQVDGGLAFSSSLPSLMTNRRIDKGISPQSVFHYLYCHVIPSPDTVYAGVKKLLPGHYVEMRGGEIETGAYWKLHFSREKARLPFAGLQREFLATVESDVRQQVQDGGNVGCFLSGGTDSSTVAGMLSRVVDGPAQSYSIGFDESGFDEMEYARVASRHFGTNHHEYYVTGDDVFELVPRIGDIYGEPFGNSSAVPSYFCAAMAKSDGIDTMLAGDGGDELFGGNSRYSVQKLFGVYQTIPAGLRNALVEPLLGAIPYGDKIFPVRKMRRYVEQAKMPMPDRMESYNLLNMLGMDIMFEPSFLNAIERERPLRDRAGVYHSADASTMMNRMLALDIKFILADNDLPKVNKMCELAGVRARFPLLGDGLVEFSAGLPVDQKVKFLKLRYFFKRALRDFLPQEVITKSKHGFGLPIGRWLVSHGRLRGLALDSLNSFKRRGIIRAEFIDDLIENTLEKHPDYYGTLVWIVMILEHWLDQNGADVSWDAPAQG